LVFFQGCQGSLPFLTFSVQGLVAQSQQAAQQLSLIVSVCYLALQLQ